MTQVLEKLHEYAAMGTPHIWRIDPGVRQMFRFRDNCLAEVAVLQTAEPVRELCREEIFTA